MRRVHRHAITGTVVSGLVAAAVLMTAGPLGGVAADQTPTLAVPAAASPSSAASSAASPDADRDARPNRDAERPAASEAAGTAATRRQTALGEQGKAITEAAAAAEAKAKREKAAKAKAKAAAEKARYARLGYEPGTTDPREIARQMMRNKWGWGEDQYGCLNNIVMRESMWQIDATNASSGAYGIPQSLPGTKMATVGADWRTNPATQITWMLGYLKDRYGSPCGGWAFKSSHGWY